MPTLYCEVTQTGLKLECMKLPVL